MTLLVCSDCMLSEFECECVECYFCDGDHEDDDCPNRPDLEEEDEN